MYIYICHSHTIANSPLLLGQQVHMCCHKIDLIKAYKLFSNTEHGTQFIYIDYSCAKASTPQLFNPSRSVLA